MKQLTLIFRSLMKESKLTLVNVLCMSVGLVSAGIIFAHVYQEFNYDTQNNISGEIYRVISEEEGEKMPYSYAPLAEVLKSNFPEIENSVRVSFYYGYLACSSNQNKYNETSAIFADPDFFTMFSFPLLKGDHKTCLVEPNSIVLSEKAATKYFGNAEPLGKTIQIGEDKRFFVTGVYQDFKTNSNFKGDIVLPLKKISKLTQIWIEPSWKYQSDIHTFVHLAAKSNMNEIASKSTKLASMQLENRTCTISFQKLKDIHINKQLFWESGEQANVSYLYILILVGSVILVVSCTNFLFLYIGSTTQRSIATGIKKICGAGKHVLFFEYFRGVIVLMLVSLLVAIILFAIYQTKLVYYFSSLPHIEMFDYKMLLLIIAVLFIVALISGIYPSIVLASQKPTSIIHSRRNMIKGKYKLVNFLVIGQFAMCIILISGTFFMHKQVNFIEKKDPGYAKNELITIPLNMHIGQGIYNEKFDLFTEELKKYPGVKNATLAYSSPSSLNTGGDNPNWQGKPEGKNVSMMWGPVFYNYFETLGLNIVEGRSFNRQYSGDEVNWDKRTCAYVLNQKAVKEMGIINPIGKEFEVYGLKGPIIGIVEDYNVRSFHSEIAPVFFQAHPFFLNEIIIRIDPTNESVLSDIETVWNKFVTNYPLEFGFVSDQVKKLYQPERNLAGTLNVFSVIAIIIACMGLFTLTILAMNQRIKEIGIRKVNGAKVTEILTMLNKDFIKWVAIAFVIACPIARFAISKWLENFAYKTTLSWWVFALAGVLALGIALLTVSFQSYKAAIRNPIEALRYE